MSSAGIPTVNPLGGVPESTGVAVGAFKLKN